MDPPTPDSSPPSSPEPPPWAVPWEGEGGPLPVLVGVAAPVLLRGETERLLRDLGRSRPLPPSLRHLKRVRGGPGGAAVLLCLEEELGGDGDPRASSVPMAPGSPGATHVPTDMGSPNATHVPMAPGPSDATRTPSVTNGPKDSGPSCATRTPVATHVPMDMGSPSATHVPIAPGPPDATNAPMDMGSPSATHVPIAPGPPGATNTPMDPRPPSITDVPMAPTPPDATGPPVTTHVPSSPRPLPPLHVLLGQGVSPHGLGPPFRVLLPGRTPTRGPETATAGDSGAVAVGVPRRWRRCQK
ncbi:vegetative cell wall protein gp1-like isoform X2 [Gallus gallus]|uniref:vegetative cell wall protein gp1-like isoform X2 n=1 Tax=Gallus gallus TaxID=9031 RepID=UPI001AE2B9F3|nr:vegetative cell wall protein gp1-like isoform X2 [Gallus gallus]